MRPGTSKRFFWRRFRHLLRGPEPRKDKRVMVAPKPSLSVKLTLLGKNAKKVDELGDKFKEVLRGPSTEPFGTPKRICPKRPDTPRNLRNFWNLGETLVKPWRSLGGTFCGTFWQPKTDLPHRTIEGRSAILPRNLYYGWRPQSGKNIFSNFNHLPFWALHIRTPPAEVPMSGLPAGDRIYLTVERPEE